MGRSLPRLEAPRVVRDGAGDAARREEGEAEGVARRGEAATEPRAAATASPLWEAVNNESSTHDELDT